MNYLKRALLSVTRKRGKSAILFSVILILGNVIAGAIAISQSTQNVEKQIKSQLGAFATIELDYEQLGNSMNVQPLSEDLIKQIGERSEVKQYDYLREEAITVEKLKTHQVMNLGESEESTSLENQSNWIYLTGTNLLKPLVFDDNTVSLLKGRFFYEDEHVNGKFVGIISEEVAQANGVNIGDEILLDSQFENYSSTGEKETKQGNEYPVEIIGIFKNNNLETKDDSNQEGGNSLITFDDRPFNTIYLPNKVVKLISEKEHEGKQMAFPSEENLPVVDYFTPQFILNQPDDVDQFKQEVTPLLPTGYKVSASTDEYDRVGTSMNRLSQISSYVVVIAILASLVIISLIIVLFTRDRKYELGIYLSLGEKRKYVFSQIVIELLMIGLSAMLISLVTGNLLGKVVSESLLSSSLLESNQTATDVVSNTSTIDQSMLNEAFRVQYTLSYVLVFLLTGISTILLSAILPLVYILRLNPKKIML
ncbi:ABC transporter permease [Enterococcus sp. DIV0840c]|uniref:ABC transporter permease n=1 Tax=Enterococcus sp. DIV0840c TaxID=2774772 RepID=UPI003D28F16C